MHWDAYRYSMNQLAFDHIRVFLHLDSGIDHNNTICQTYRLLEDPTNYNIDETYDERDVNQFF
jgi:hypothetical protein